MQRGLGDYPAARALHAEGLAIHRALRDNQGIGNELTNLGMIAYLTGDYAAARALHEESLAIRRRSATAAAWRLRWRPRPVAYRQGDYADGAGAARGESADRQALGDATLPESLEGLAAVAAAQGAATRAARLLGAAATMRAGDLRSGSSPTSAWTRKHGSRVRSGPGAASGTRHGGREPRWRWNRR